MSTETLLAIVISVPLGVLCSMIAWWVVARHLSPELLFSPSISKVPDSTTASGYKYRVKLKNPGRRDVIDLQFKARLHVRGISEEFPLTWSIVQLPTSAGSFPVMRARKGNRVLKLMPEHLRSAEQWVVPSGLLESVVSLEEALSLGSRAHLRLTVFGYDRFSGARRLFESKRYTAADIVEGRFGKGSTVEIAPVPTGIEPASGPATAP